MKIKFNVLASLFVVVTLIFPFCTISAQTTKLDQEVWVFFGNGYQINAENKGRVSNIGYIETKNGGIIVNTGISHNHAEQILKQISKISDKEKLIAIITQGTQKFALGAYSLDNLGVRTYAHPRAASQMAQRCIYCIQYLNDTLGIEEMKYTQVDEPDDIALLRLSPHSPLRDIIIIDHGDTKSNGVIMIYHKPSEVLFAGDVVFSGIVPNIKESNLTLWIKSLKLLRELPISVIVPGVGPNLTKAAIGDSLAYLEALDITTERLYEGNLDLLSATKNADLSQFSHWGLYNERHSNNVMYRYLQIEEDELTLK
ncbi:MBL fold metallo-hydrolase [Burkholderiales bacterium]|nr:MBL fold metallo-hydrolase [Burkholderiales bacterium]